MNTIENLFFGGDHDPEYMAKDEINRQHKIHIMFFKKLIIVTFLCCMLCGGLCYWSVTKPEIKYAQTHEKNIIVNEGMTTNVTDQHKGMTTNVTDTSHIYKSTSFGLQPNGRVNMGTPGPTYNVVTGKHGIRISKHWVVEKDGIHFTMW